MQRDVQTHNVIRTNQRIEFVFYVTQRNYKTILYLTSLLEKVLEKLDSFCRIMGIIKISFKRVLSGTKCFSEVKTFNSFWMFSVTAEKVGDVGGDDCSVFV